MISLSRRQTACATSGSGARQRLATVALAILWCGLVAGPAAAMDKQGNFNIRGAGTVSCATYLNATPKQKRHAETWWAGYLSAMNRATPKTYDIMGNVTTAAASRWLQAWCQKNPKRRFAEAVHAMLQAAYPNRQQTSPT